MKMLSKEVESLLDRLYNLRSSDSVIISKMNKERDEAIETGERTKKEKETLLVKIDELSKDADTLQDEGAKLLWETPENALGLITECFDKLVASKDASIYSTKFVVLRDRKILEYYLNISK